MEGSAPLNKAYRQADSQRHMSNDTRFVMPMRANGTYGFGQQKLREGSSIPPRPMVEDERAALAREVPSSRRDSPVPIEHNPPARGKLEQYPVILEADISPEEAARLDAKLRKEDKEDAQSSANQRGNAKDFGERRFVLLSDPHSSSSDRENKESRKPDRASTTPQTGLSSSSPSKQGDPRRVSTGLGPGRSSKAEDAQRSARREDVRRTETRPLGPQPVTRRRSRHEDLPTLQTNMASQQPSLQRASSYTPQSYMPAPQQKPRTPSADCSKPAERSGASKSKRDEYPESRPPRMTRCDTSGRLETPTSDTRRSGRASPSHSPSSSRPSTPGSEKRWSAGEGLAQASAKLTRSQKLANDNLRPRDGAERSSKDQQASYSRESSSSEQYYLSLDDDLGDSSDSDRQRRRHHRHHRHHGHGLHPHGKEQRHRSRSRASRASLEVKPQSSKQSSPRVTPGPSPNVSPSHLPSIDRRDPRLNMDHRRSTAYPADSHSRDSNIRLQNGDGSRQHISTTQQSTQVAAPGASAIPIPTRAEYEASTSRIPPAQSYYDDELDPRTKPRVLTDESNTASSWASRTHATGWQKPNYIPQASERPARAAGSYRRYSEDAGDNSIVKLPECSRATPVKGYNDWLTLPGCHGFRICPKCVRAFHGTPFGNQFIQAQIRYQNEEIACDFGSEAWFRIAWLLARSQNNISSQPICSIAAIVKNEKPCMGKHHAKREWFSILDPTTAAPVRQFNMCKSCKLCIEAILPNLRGIFVDTTKGPAGPERTCDMRFDSRRFVEFFDALEIMATSTPHPRRGLDTSEFVSLAKRYGSASECTKLLDIANGTWWTITQLPDFTVCQSCFDEVVHPALLQRRAIAALLTRKEKNSQATSCQLYSDRMRDIFDKACDENDYRYLAGKVRDRKAKEIAFKKDRELLKLAIKNGERGAKEKLTALEEGWRRWE